MNSLLSYLKNKQLVWHGSHQCAAMPDTSRSGYPELDNALHGGLPEQGVIDICSITGIGECRLLLPHIAHQQQQHKRLLTFIAPPYRINAELLLAQGIDLKQTLMIYPDSPEHALWAAEQCLASGSCCTVMLWHQALTIHQVKRLQLAARKGESLQILFRPEQQQQSLPVTLGLQLQPHSNGLNARISKQKGGWPGEFFSINMRTRWPWLYQRPQPDNLLHFPRSRAS
ncbi:translesion DNA synthesis-associated protein ImuA [Aestuariibacter salexigens]|uniref:translesion DNA synthesis-associated protein ImuA n=1 Tax=Aestuariibacter salexigens TaxID=226010 RepID=UPI0004167A23|nr:translesion DNA synthesis-associated protein ImuA [Aestuariibacter salexigens]